MTPEQLDRVFGSGRLKMATGEHVEVFREAVAPGERRRYTKRFLSTCDGDFGPWTDREWRILARLIGHGIRCVPDVVQFDGGAMGGLRLVQTYDAGVTVDQWATLLPVARGSAMRRHIFEDCAHWWALAHHCLAALNEIHALELVHLDIKADNICIPYGPADFDPDSDTLRIYPLFPRLALIDFAFSLVSRESLAMALPIGWQKDYDYQSPRLLKALEAGRDGDLELTKELDWRCDFYSLAAMLKRYLPADSRTHAQDDETGWTSQRYDDARNLIFRLRDTHDRDLSQWRPHLQLMDFTITRLNELDLAASLDHGWMLARDAVPAGTATPITPITPATRVARTRRAGTITPMTRIAPSQRRAETMPTRGLAPPQAAVVRTRIVSRVASPAAATPAPRVVRARVARHGAQAAKALILIPAALFAVAAPSFIGDPDSPVMDRARETLAALRSNLRAQLDYTLVAENAPAPIPARSRGQDRSASPADRSSPAQQEPPVSVAPMPAQASSVSTPVQESMPPMATTAENQTAAPSTPVEVPVAAGESAAMPASDKPRVALSSVEPRPIEAVPPSAKARTGKPGPPANRPQAAKRSPPSATASTAKRLRGPSTAIASASGRSDPRHVSSQSAPVHSASPPVRIAAAAVAPPAPLPSPQAPSPASVSGGTPVDQGVAQTSAAPTPSTTTESASPSHEDRQVAAPQTGSGAAAESPPRQQQAAAKPSRPAKPQLRDDWHALVDTVLGMLRPRDRPPAPVEERSMQASTLRESTPRRSAQSAPSVLAQAAPAARATNGVQGNAGTRPASAPTPSAVVAPIPFGDPVPLTIEPVVEATPAPSGALAAASVERRGQAGAAPAAAPSPSVADARALNTPSSIPVPFQYAAPSAAEPARARAQDYGQDAWVTQAKRVLSETVPQVAAQAEPDVSRVLRAAARANQPYQIPAVAEAASATWASQHAWIPVSNIAPSHARLLHNNARQALAAGRDVSAVVDLELQAFGANPRDADIAGYLAFLHLRMRPVQAETARQLTLQAIALSGSQRATRSDDWGRLAVASALTGRETDAIRAFLTEIALSTNVDRSCYSALGAYATFGEPLRVPVQAMLYRVHSLGYAYPSCAWPSSWNMAARAPASY